MAPMCAHFGDCLVGAWERAGRAPCWQARPCSCSHHGVGGTAAVVSLLRGAHWPLGICGPVLSIGSGMFSGISLPIRGCSSLPARQTSVPHVSDPLSLAASPSLVLLVFVLCSVWGFSNDPTCKFSVKPINSIFFSICSTCQCWSPCSITPHGS